MDRRIVYPGAIAQDQDILRSQKNALVGLGNLALALLGNGTWVDGFACVPGTGLQATVGAGQVYVASSVDSSPYGSVAADANTVLKQGLFTGPQSFSCPAPSTAGQGVMYLIEAQFVEVDGDPVVLPYYNASNPASPLNGAGGNNVAQNTSRACKINLQIKAGTPATIGATVPPTVDVGWVGLWNVYVVYGASSITTGNISRHGDYISKNVARGLISRLTGFMGGGSGLDADTVQGLNPTQIAAWKGAVVYPYGTVTIPSSANLQWQIGTDGIDTIGAFSAGNRDRLVVPVGVTKAKAKFNIEFPALSVGDAVLLTLRFYKAGAGPSDYKFWRAILAGEADYTQPQFAEVSSPVLQVSAGDYFVVNCFYASSGSGGVTASAYFAVDALQ